MREAIRVSGEGAPEGLRLSRPDGSPIMVVVSPVRSRHLAAPAVVIYLGDSQRRSAIDPILLGGLFGFSPAESKVAVQMMHGHTVDDIATTLGISRNTARNHLKRLYAKTGTSRQCEFVHAMLTSPAPFAISEWRDPRH